jgi:hypothetical protein
MSNRKNSSQKSRLGAETRDGSSDDGGKSAQKTSAHGAGGTFRHTEIRKGLRYNE